MSGRAASRGTTGSYITGYLMSLALTLSGFYLVHRHLGNHHLSPSDNFMLAALAVLATAQLLVQLSFWLHLNQESRPWWNIQALIFAAGTVFILVGGSIWIMENLNYHHGPRNLSHSGHSLTTPQQTNQYIIQDEGIHR